MPRDSGQGWIWRLTVANPEGQQLPVPWCTWGARSRTVSRTRQHLALRRRSQATPSRPGQGATRGADADPVAFAVARQSRSAVTTTPSAPRPAAPGNNRRRIHRPPRSRTRRPEPGRPVPHPPRPRRRQGVITIRYNGRLRHIGIGCAQPASDSGRPSHSTADCRHIREGPSRVDGTGSCRGPARR